VKLSTTTTRWLLALGLAGVLVLFVALATSAQPPIPHPIEEDGISFEDCVGCHRAGVDDAPLLAADHAQHSNGDCRNCHATTGMDAPLVNHPVEGRIDCRGCHERGIEYESIPSILDSEYDHGIYFGQTCLSCHPVADEFPTDQPPIGCGVCHPKSVQATNFHNGPERWVECVDCHQGCEHYPHDLALMPTRNEDCLACHYDLEGAVYSARPDDRYYSLNDHIGLSEPHASVDCTACHLKIAAVERNLDSGRIEVVLPKLSEGQVPDSPELAAVVREVDCTRCHTSANPVGASAAQLAPRSLLCLGCHDASLVVKDAFSWAGVLLFGLGMVLMASIWVQGSVGRGRVSLPRRIGRIALAVLDFVFSIRILVFLWSFLVDGLLLRQVLRKSITRWLAHTLMFWAFGARMLWGVATWLLGWIAPLHPLTQALVNKNAPLVALVYDLLALLVIIGAVLALIRRFVKRDEQLISGGQDAVAIALLGSIFLMGFVAEGARIIVTDLRPELAVFSFVGYPLSLLFDLIPLQWHVIYSWLWYVHVALVVTFVAYLPFSKFFHILLGPLMVAVNAALKEH
jgi:predicted CXXCH cytochrome family protein